MDVAYEELCIKSSWELVILQTYCDLLKGRIQHRSSIFTYT